jgi:hypothetical protein
MYPSRLVRTFSTDGKISFRGGILCWVVRVLGFFEEDAEEEEEEERLVSHSDVSH